MLVARRFVISGRVQGVGFRYFTQECALREGLTGWVRNLPDGRVEMQASGEETEVRDFIAAIGQSELRAHIRKQTELILPQPPASRGFEIRHD